MTPSLPSELTIYTVGELHPQWLTWLTAARLQAGAAGSPGESFAVDAAAVGEVDAAGVQLLLSLSHALRQAHRALHLRHPSRALAEACNALGAGALLALPAGSGAAA